MDKFKSLNHFVQHNKHYHTKVLLSSLDLNGHAFGIHSQTQKLEPPTFYSVINSITEKYRFAYSFLLPFFLRLRVDLTDIICFLFSLDGFC